MSEHTNLAAKVHEILANRNLGADAKISEIEAMLPAPPRPTLADMTPDDRLACMWMQCDVRGRKTSGVIVSLYCRAGHARVLWPDGFVGEIDLERITPLPDLPRMECGGKKPEPEPAPALPGRWRFAEHPDHGLVIVTRLTQDSEGNVLFVIPSTGHLGHKWRSCKPAELTYLDQEADTVPESTLAVGSEWDDADALTRACKESGRDQITMIDKDGDVSVWDADTRWWGTGAPDYGFEPYTILHAGKKADQ